MGTGNEEDPTILQESEVTARRPGGLGIPTSLPRLRRKNFLPPGHLLRLAALTQCKGATQVRVLQRMSDQPSGPFPSEGDVLQLRLCAPAPFAFVPQTSTARLLGLRAARSHAPGNPRAPGCLFPSLPSPDRPLILSALFPRSKPPRANPRAREPRVLISSIYLPHFRATGAQPQRSLPWGGRPGTEELGKPACPDRPRL